ncbi:hypothetical protein EJD97_017923 [Solanum chilense]|uniref:Retrovirus-related Pol polyprotein from transposon TNT 1-94 n=1 Tax=Solanum chilense TaxID=4083 RepID=A0A6N2AG24_SOLCI|nr:hypothetical protein EJD97_017923 [Solanum chilense]
MYQKDLHEPLTGVKPESMTEEKWKLKDRQALGLIRLTLSRNVAFNIVKEKTTSDEIKALILMSSLPESWDPIVAAISSSRGSEKLKFDEIRDVVLSESIHKREVGDSSGSALNVDRKARIEDIGNALILSVNSPVESLILASGASFHSSPSKELFQNFKSGNLGKLDITGYAAVFGKGSWKIVKGAMVVARGTKSGTVYTTAGCINMAAVAEGASGSCL